jgi:hypothetical protein
MVADLARRYALDGVHLDYARYPNQQFDYSRFAIAAFAPTSVRAWPSRRAARSTCRRRPICSPIQMACRPSGKRSGARLTSLVARIRQAVRGAPTRS